MNTIDATDARNKFGELIDLARREPIQIKKNGRPSVIMIAFEDYQKLAKKIEKLEDMLDILEAENAEKEEFAGAAVSEALLERIRNGKD